MNDASELVEPLRIANGILTNLRRQFETDHVKDKGLRETIIMGMMDDISKSKSVNICVISFCSNGDLLSQWRGYGAPGSAYSIGLDKNKLIHAMLEHSFQLRRCEYFDPDAYQNEIKRFILELIEVALRKREVQVDFRGKLVNKVTTMKFKCFEEEREWRLVSRKPLLFTDGKFKFKAGKSMVIPYYSLPLDLSIVTEIIIGPCQHPELAESAIYGLAWKFSLKNVLRDNIKLSKIPYRVF
jgi:hypothetical protein